MRLLLAASVLGLLVSCGGGSSDGGPGSGRPGDSSSSSSSSGSGASASGSSSSGAGSSSSGDASSSSSGGSPSSSGSSSGAASSSSGGGDGGPPASQACANPPYVLQMDPSNPQSGVTLGGFYVDTDTWNAANYTVSQTMYVCDYNNWYVVANMNNDSGDGAVKTYPNVHKDFTGAPAIHSFSTISSSFAHAAPHVGIYEFAYDIWLNGVASAGSTEVMIWTDNFHQVPSGSSVESVTMGGQTYQVYKSGSYIAFVETANVTSGTVDLLAVFNHVIAKGWIPDTSTVGAIDYGVEIVSTNGADATFQVTGFSLTTN